MSSFELEMTLTMPDGKTEVIKIPITADNYEQAQEILNKAYAEAMEDVLDQFKKLQNAIEGDD